ncbi:DUF805 domain-containing protein [Streptomyces sp. NPDC006997]|uniref:DUF805 domain-containing protein n=1 Tax=Streptomyces sp. NPDC006997 TaxID=3155356 RepID=UPI0033FB23F4
MQWFIAALKKYAEFSGRARRKEYWMFVLFSSLIYVVLMGVGLAADLTWLPVVFGAAMLVPSLSVGVRRLHDTGRSGWWLLIGAVPFVGGVVLLVFACLDGQPGVNKYGPNPKEAPVLV